MKFCLIWKQGILQKKYDFHKKKMKLLLAGDYEGMFCISVPLFASAINYCASLSAKDVYGFVVCMEMLLHLTRLAYTWRMASKQNHCK